MRLMALPCKLLADAKMAKSLTEEPEDPGDFGLGSPTNVKRPSLRFDAL
jgi:hypothetical protein